MAIAARRRRTRSRLPPKAYEEEVSLQADLPSHSGHTLFVALDNWNPSSSLGSHCTRQPESNEPGPSTAIAEQPYSPCYVVEEAPPEPTKETTEAEQERQQHCAKVADAATSEEFRDSHRWEQPSAEDWGYLNLIFEIRDKLDDQIFRLERMDQRLDMFFAAHSRASSKKQCPTCARTYSFPARWRHSEI
jgi:hypothetical protein